MLVFLLISTLKKTVAGVFDAVGIPSFAGVPFVVSIPACNVSVEFASLLLLTLLKSIFLLTLASLLLLLVPLQLKASLPLQAYPAVASVSAVTGDLAIAGASLLLSTLLM